MPLIASLVLVLLGVLTTATAGSTERANVERRLSAGLDHQAAGRLVEARDAFNSVLERDSGNLRAMAGLAEVAASSGDSDEEVYFLGRYVDRASRIRELAPEARKTQRLFEKRSGKRIPTSERWRATAAPTCAA